MHLAPCVCAQVDGRDIVGEADDRDDRPAGILQRLDGAGAVALRQDAVDLRVGGEQARDALLLRPERVIAVVVADDLDVGILASAPSRSRPGAAPRSARRQGRGRG